MFTFNPLYDFDLQNESSCEENELDRNNSNISTFSTLPDKLWVIPGHILFSYEKGYKLQSLVANDYSSGTFSRCDPEFLLSFQHPVIEICTVSLPNDDALLIVTQNGDVHVWRYDCYDLEWCKQFSFQLRSGSNETELQAAVFHEQLEFCMWCEKHGSGSYENSIFVRKYSSITPRTISDFCLNDYISLTVLTHCPELNFCNLGALVTITFIMENRPNIFMVWCSESGISMLDTNGTLLWSDSTSPYRRFAKILTCTLNSWKSNGEKVIGHVSNKVHNRLYILVENGMLLSFNLSGVLCSKTILPLEKETEVLGFYIYSTFVFIFSSSEIFIYCLKNGTKLGSLPLKNEASLLGTWYYSSSISVFGFYTKEFVYRIVLKDYLSILNSFDKIDVSLGNADLDFLFKMNCILSGKNISNLEIANMALPSLQSKAMVLALVNHCGQHTDAGDENMNDQIIERLVNGLPEAPNQKLKRLLRSLVECFLKLHYYCNHKIQ